MIIVDMIRNNCYRYIGYAINFPKQILKLGLKRGVLCFLPNKSKNRLNNEFSIQSIKEVQKNFFAPEIYCFCINIKDFW